MLSAKLLSCLAVASAIVMSSCEAHAGVADPDEGSKVLTSPSSAISQHDTTQSLRTADAAVSKASEERMFRTGNFGISRNSFKIAEEVQPSEFGDIIKAFNQARTDAAVREGAPLIDDAKQLFNHLSSHMSPAPLETIHALNKEFQEKHSVLVQNFRNARLASNEANSVYEYMLLAENGYFHPDFIKFMASPDTALDQFHLKHILQTKKAIASNLAHHKSEVQNVWVNYFKSIFGSKESTINRDGEGLGGHVDKSNAAAPKDQIDEANNPLLNGMGNDEEKKPVRTKYSMFKLFQQEYLKNLEAEYLRHNQAGNVDKSKAAGDAHAGTDHAAV